MSVPLVNAATGMNTEGATQITLDTDSAVSVVFDKDIDVDYSILKTQSNVSLNKVNLKVNQGNIILTGNLLQNNDTYNLELTGTLYPHNHFDDIIFVKMDRSELFNNVEIRFENNPPPSLLDINFGTQKEIESIIFLSLEDQDSGELLTFTLPMPKSSYNQILSDAKLNLRNLSDEDYNKIINEIAFAGKLRETSSVSDSQSVQLSSSSDKTNTVSSTWTNIQVNYSDLEKMISDLYANPNSWLKMSDYNVPQSLFTQTGWKKDDRNNLDSLYANTIHTGGYEGLLAISRVVTMIVYPSSNKIAVQVEPNGRVASSKQPATIRLDRIGGNIKLYKSDGGIRFFNIKLALGALSVDNVYNEQLLTGVFRVGGNPNWSQYAQAVLGFVPYVVM